MSAAVERGQPKAPMSAQLDRREPQLIAEGPLVPAAVERGQPRAPTSAQLDRREPQLIAEGPLPAQLIVAAQVPPPLRLARRLI